MATQQLYQNILTRSKLTIALLFGILLLLAANVLLDYLYTLFRNSSFYISESLLFSSYWLLFLPFLPLVLRIVNETNRMEIKWLAVGAAIGVHTFLYPALVWIISRTFYGYTFDYWQTFNYGMSAYFIKTVIIYGFSMVSLTIWANKSRVRMAGATEVDRKKEFIRTILVADHNNKKLLLQVDDILYFSANSPYVGIYHSEKKYLHTETLRELEARLDPNQFVRIHKSHIVNIRKIRSIQSRQNGDYDVTLSDNTVLRVSRNFAKPFKQVLYKQHQLALK